MLPSTTYPLKVIVSESSFCFGTDTFTPYDSWYSCNRAPFLPITAPCLFLGICRTFSDIPSGKGNRPAVPLFRQRPALLQSTHHELGRSEPNPRCKLANTRKCARLHRYLRQTTAVVANLSICPLLNKLTNGLKFSLECGLMEWCISHLNGIVKAIILAPKKNRDIHCSEYWGLHSVATEISQS